MSSVARKKQAGSTSELRGTSSLQESDGDDANEASRIPATVPGAGGGREAATSTLTPATHAGNPRRQPTPATHAGNLAAHRLAKTSESSTRPAASRSDNATLPTVQPPAGRSDCADVGTAALAGHLGHLQCRR
ncbi:unnamed protein product [Lampetra fluviatilis]